MLYIPVFLLHVYEHSAKDPGCHESRDFLLLIGRVVTGATRGDITVVFIELALPTLQGAEADTQVLTAFFLSEVRMFADILEGVKFKLLIVLFALA